MTTTWKMGVVALAFACFSCADPTESYSIAVRVTVTNDRAEPIEEAEILLDDIHVATSDVEGKAFATLQSQRARVQIGVHCPSGYRNGAPQMVVLTGRSSDPGEVSVPLSCLSATQ